MVTAINSNSYGDMKRIGMTQDYRVLYQVVDAQGNNAGFLSVAEKDMDTFEKTSKDIVESGAQVQKYVSEHSSPEELKKRRVLSGFLTGFGGLLGAFIPFAYAKVGITKKIALTATGLVAGLAAGFASSLYLTEPPGAYELEKSAKTLKKLDIKKVEQEPELIYKNESV